MIIKSQVLDQIPNILHGFGTFEEPIAGFAKSNIPLHWKQVHGVEFAEVKSQGQECGEVDALYSDIPGIPISVVTADCVPILLSHRFGKRVAAVHAGWRGTRAGILKNLWNKLKGLGEVPQDWVAAVGPAIGPCCYEVSADLAMDFTQAFGADFDVKRIIPRDRILDLPLLNALELEKLGFHKVDLIRSCTRCSIHPRFHSHRRDHTGTRQYSSILKTL